MHEHLIIAPGSFKPLLVFSQGRNPTWGRPVKRSRPQRSPSPSCSSLPSGRWRTSSMSLHWSSSSLSGHMLSEKRMENSTCWLKTSSMRKSTPKTEDSHVNRGARGGYFIQARMCSLVWKRRDYRWWWLLCYSHVCQPTGRGAHISSAGCVPSSSQAFTPFHLHDKGHQHKWPLLARCWKRPLRQLIRPWLLTGLHCSRLNPFIGSVLFGCVLLFFNSLLWLSFVCEDGDIFHDETASPSSTTTNLKRFYWLLCCVIGLEW